ncbi:MAG: TlpA disulfide reductase family protein [Thermoanaerobaculia bacterium]
MRLFLLALLATLAPLQAAEPVKHLLPAQYQDRVVALRKGRVLVVNFWATWCEPCREEMPALERASRAFSSKDLAVVLVSLDSARLGPTAVPKFLESKRIPFVCWLAKSRDPQTFIDAVDKNWDGTLPYTMIYDRTGKPALKLTGRQTVESFSEAIRKVMGKA